MSVPQIAFQLAVAYVTSLATKGDPETPLIDEKPSTTATRGTTLPLLIGREKLGAKIGWVGFRTSYFEDTPGQGGKGFGQSSSGQSRVWEEKGWHQLCVGPAWQLRAIYENGTILWDNDGVPFNARDFPSGSTVTIDPDNVFRIYWGESDQPLNTELAATLGVQSHWPFCCYIYWVKKRLGGFPNWQALEYDLEVRPYKVGQLYNGGTSYDYDALPTALAGSDAWMENGYDANVSPVHSIVQINNKDLPTIPRTRIKICDPFAVIDFTSEFPADQLVRISGNSPSTNGDYRTLGSSFDALETMSILNPNSARPFLTNCELWSDRNMLGVDSSASNALNLPPGIQLNPDNTGTRWNRVYIQSGNDNDVYARVPLSPAGPTPPGAGGSPLNLGTATNVFRMYIDTVFMPHYGLTWNVTLVQPGFVGQFNPPDRQGMSFEVHLNDIRGGGTIGNASNYTQTNLNGRWWELSFEYTTAFPAAGHLDPTLPIYLNVEPFSSGGDIHVLNDQLVFVVSGDGSGQANESWIFENPSICTGVTTITFDFDFFLPTFGVGQIASMQPGPLGVQGGNGAHIVNQLTRSSFPHGAGTDDGCWNVASLEAAGVLLSSAAGEGLRSHIFGGDGTEFASLLGSLLVDLGMTVGWDITQDITLDGSLKYTLVRETVTQIVLSDAHVLPQPPAVDRTLEAAAVTVTVYTFRSSERNFKDDSITIGDDGKAFAEERIARASDTLLSVRDLLAAQSVATRRDQENANPFTNYTILAHKDAARLYPGDPIILPASTGLQLPLRVLKIQDSTDSGKVTISAAVDVYSIAATIESSLFGGTGTGATGGTNQQGAADPLTFTDTQQSIFEVGPLLASQMSFVFLRTRTDLRQGTAAILTSEDGSTYEGLSFGAPSSPGGLLIGDFPASYTEVDILGLGNTEARNSEIEYGPAFLSDTDDPLDLPVLDEANWRAGRMVVFLNGEILFPREVMPIGNSVYQLRGVMRGRFDTTIGNHVTGDSLYVMHFSDVRFRSDVLQGKDVLAYFKYLVECDNVLQSPAAAAALTITPKGKALRPMDPLNLRTTYLTPAFETGDDVELLWDWKSPDGYADRTGLGMQKFGEVVLSGSPLQGTFTLVILDASGSTTFRTVEGLTAPTYTYLAVDRIADFSSDQDFRVDVIHIGPAAEASARATQIFEFV